MATYNFTFPASAAGKSVSVRDAAGDEVATATAGSASSVQGPIVVTKELPVGEYVATATDSKIFYSSRATGVLDVPASLTTVGGRVADAVDPESETFAADLVAALEAAGLMAEPEA